jgi:hypothetical protein
MDTVLTTLNTRIGKKSIAIDGDTAKINSLTKQRDLYDDWIEKAEALRKVKIDEKELLLNLKVEAEVLIKRRKSLQAYTDGLREKFDAIEWRPDLRWEEKIESTDYHEKVAERHSINERLTEIEKTANKIYYRR